MSEAAHADHGDRATRSDSPAIERCVHSDTGAEQGCCDVELETAIDASLIGGAVIDAGDVVIDGSLKGKLSRLQSALAG